MKKSLLCALFIVTMSASCSSREPAPVVDHYESAQRLLTLDREYQKQDPAGSQSRCHGLRDGSDAPRLGTPQPVT
jgi:hypothetical protein